LQGGDGVCIEHGSETREVPVRRLRGVKALVHDAVDATAELVGEAHEVAARWAMWVVERIEPLAEPGRVVNGVRRVSTQGVIGTIRAVNRLVEELGDAGMDALERRAAPAVAAPPVPMRSDRMRSAEVAADAAIGALNGLVGDRLETKGNGLALDMQLRLGDAYVAPEEIDADRVVVLVHGLSATEWSWCLEAETFHGDAGVHFGTLLARDLGYTPVFLRYNSGRHISVNGRELAALLERIDCRELVLVGHSMGGLVSRSACAYGEEAGHDWVGRLTHLCALGSPHLGAPLEKLGNVLTAALGVVEVPATFVPRTVLAARSAGIKDLRFGYLRDEDWQDADPDALLENGRTELPLLGHVTYGFVATTLTADLDHPVGHAIGDLLVRRPSARGPAEGDHARRFVHEVSGVAHHLIQNHPSVYAKLLEVLSA
jgi:pimeloyl-ACP methyl ester carboxylesterase